MNNPRYRIGIIGSGAAGVMAALRGVLNNNEVILYTGSPRDKKKSREMWVSKVENMPGYFSYNKGIVEPNKETLAWIEKSEFSDNLDVRKNSVIEIKQCEDGTFNIIDDEGHTENVFATVLATGIMDVQPEIQGTIKSIFPYANVQLADYCIRCDGHHAHHKKTAIIGHSNSAAWVAILLKERYEIPEMHLILNGKNSEIEEETKLLLELYKIKIHRSEIDFVVGDAKNKILKGFKLKDGNAVEVDIAFVSLGMIVYNQLAKSIGAKIDDRGFVLTNDKSESSVDNFYAIGDVEANKKKQIYTGWDSAVNAMDFIDFKIRELKRQSLLNNS